MQTVFRWTVNVFALFCLLVVIPIFTGKSKSSVFTLPTFGPKPDAFFY